MHGGIFLSTDLVEPSLRNDFWRAALRLLFDVGPISPDEHLKGASLTRPVGNLSITSITSNRQQYVRSPRTISSGGLDHYILYFIVSGAMTADCEHTNLSAGPGDICLFDLAQPFQSRAEAGGRISLVIPRDRIDRITNGWPVHGLHLRSDDPLAGMLRSVVLQLHREANAILPTDIVAAETAIIDFIATIIAGKALKNSSGKSASEPSLRQHMLRYIDDSLTDPELGPAGLMHRFQVSRAHLYRIFASSNGVAGVIRSRRLDTAYRRLKAGEMHSRTLTELAYELGFSSSGHFSRAFKNRFGISPRDVTKGIKPEGKVTTLQSHLSRMAKCWSIQRNPKAVEALLANMQWPGAGSAASREHGQPDGIKHAINHHVPPR